MNLFKKSYASGICGLTEIIFNLFPKSVADPSITVTGPIFVLQGFV